MTVDNVTDPGAGGQISTVDPCSSACTATIGGLITGDTYRFSVEAENGAGIGPATLSPEVVAADVPSAPTDVTATPGTGQAVVNWQAPEDSGGVFVSAYSVTAIDLSHPANGGQSLMTGATNATIGGLTPGDSYSFVVAATNAAGLGPTSTPSNTVVPLALPSPSTNRTPGPVAVKTPAPRRLVATAGKERLVLTVSGSCVKNTRIATLKLISQTIRDSKRPRYRILSADFTVGGEHRIAHASPMIETFTLTSTRSLTVAVTLLRISPPRLGDNIRRTLTIRLTGC